MYCQECDVNITASHYRSHKHKEKCCSELEPGIEIIRVAFKNRIKTYRLSTTHHHDDVNTFLEELRSKFIRFLKPNLPAKVNLELYGSYVLKKTQEIKSFNSKFVKACSYTDLDDLYDDFKQILATKSSEFKERDSGWSLAKLLFLELNINSCK